MSATATFWVLIVTLALGTWLMRSLPIMLHGRVNTPPWAERLLRYVPVAALTALMVPGALYTHTATAYTFAPARLIAMLVAFLVALRTKNVIATLAVGMGVLWLTQWGLANLAF
jgi:branched-subunit amino acid transport protein